MTGVQYNAANVTTTPNSPARTASYSLDAAGNRTLLSDSVNGNTSYTANNLNQYTAVGGGSPTYDGNGNLETSGSWTYAYDAENRLVSASSGAYTMTMAYDGHNRCVSRTVAGAATYSYFDGWNLLEERNAFDTELEKYVHGARVDELINKADSIGTVYYLYNALGNATSLTSAAGAIVEQYSYDVYGAPALTDGSGNSLTASAYNNRFLFTGREYLAGLNLYDYRNRVYSPVLGRFLQTDPIRFGWGTSRDPLGEKGGLNLYEYVRNSPIGLTDAFGLFDCNATGRALAEGLGAAIGGVLTSESGGWGAITGGVAAGAAWDALGGGSSQSGASSSGSSPTTGSADDAALDAYFGKGN